MDVPAKDTTLAVHRRLPIVDKVDVVGASPSRVKDLADTNRWPISQCRVNRNDRSTAKHLVLGTEPLVLSPQHAALRTSN